MTLTEWLTERMENCEFHASQKTGADRQGWLEDAAYFKQAIDAITPATPAVAPPVGVEELAERIRAVADEIHPYCQEDLGPDELWNRLWGKLRGIANDLEAKK